MVFLTLQVSVDKEIAVKAEWKDGTKITYEKEGDEKPGFIPADIIFTLQTKKHDRFERDGDDLIYTHTLTLAEAICGTQFTITTLDGRQLPVSEDRASPRHVKVIPGEGMYSAKRRCKGDLKIKYNIVFPDLTAEARRAIGDILRTQTSSSRK